MSEQIAIEGEEYIKKFKDKMKDVCDEVLGEVYVDLMPYIESDAWSNLREEIRIEMEHEYKYSKFKDEWAKNLRRAIFVENRDELSQLISNDILKRIKELEDIKQEYDMFRYSPKGIEYKDLLIKNKSLEKENAELRVQNDLLEKVCCCLW